MPTKFQPTTKARTGIEDDDRRARTTAGRITPSDLQLRQIYVGDRDGGHSAVFVVRDTGTERLVSPGSSHFYWGWRSSSGSRRLALALLLDLTGRVPPTRVCDEIAAEHVARLPWPAFAITGHQILAWIESHDYTISDWPPATSLTAASLIPRGVTAVRGMLTGPRRGLLPPPLANGLGDSSPPLIDRSS
jgi:hypothetical protein